MRLGIFLRVEDDLSEAKAIAQVDKDKASMIPASIDPAREGDMCGDILFFSAPQLCVLR